MGDLRFVGREHLRKRTVGHRDEEVVEVAAVVLNGTRCVAFLRQLLNKGACYWILGYVWTTSPVHLLHPRSSTAIEYPQR